MNFHIHRAVWRWAVRRHPNKNRRWIADRYFERVGNRGWIFFGDGADETDTGRLRHMQLRFASSVPIRRHTKIVGDCNPYDPAGGISATTLQRRCRQALLSARLNILDPRRSLGSTRSVTASRNGGVRPCLSRMPGNWHVRFLEGRAGITPARSLDLLMDYDWGGGCGALASTVQNHGWLVPRTELRGLAHVHCQARRT